MRVGFFRFRSQALVLLLPVAFFFCSRNAEDAPLIPPPTNPMTREFIGYGVVNVSFVHVLKEPLMDNSSLGYLRKKSTVKIMERRSLSNRGKAETWVKIDAMYSTETGIQGWLRESALNVYENEFQAMTAAETMIP